MDEIINQLNGIIPAKYVTYITLFWLASQNLGRVIQSIRNGGGLKAILSGLWLGTNTPKTTSDAPSQGGIGGKLGLLLIIGAFAGLLAVGCTTNQQTIAYKSLYTVEKTTTGAYDGYVDSVIKGLSSTNGLPRVSRAYNTFHASYLIALDAVQFNTNAIAPASLIVEAQDVVNLITNLKGK